MILPVLPAPVASGLIMVNVRLVAMGKKIVCEATSSESGNSRVELAPLEAGKTVTVRVNPQFCVEWLRRIDPVEPVTVEAVDADNALVFRSEDSVGVVMPMEAT